MVALSSTPNCSNDHNRDMKIETTSISATISTQTEDINATKDKHVASTVKYKKTHTQYKAEHFDQPVMTCTKHFFSKLKNVKKDTQ